MTTCDRIYCAACSIADDGTYCDALSDTDFGGKKCPFFKTAEQNKREMMSCRKRLIDIGRSELLRYAEYKLAQMADESENDYGQG